ncbi:hypothetical protein GCM10022219_11500 [Microbacterium oryzae]|uniref:DNA-binding protein n=1 Tax=Microbacterium oryzae TaxID=743009 RepID=A0A6I6EBS0_9MICO|nr:helix-turn-helix domain-containing protein [Microbacterium oryzae]QGU28478.1 DNA-binding protein [Microbacterium oryzae]
MEQTAQSPVRQRFYFVPEAAAAIRRSEKATRWLIHTGALKSSKIGGRRVVTEQQIEEFFSEAG